MLSSLKSCRQSTEVSGVGDHTRAFWRDLCNSALQHSLTAALMDLAGEMLVCLPKNNTHDR